MKKRGRKKGAFGEGHGPDATPSSIRPLYFLGICVLSFVSIIGLPDSVFVPLNHVVASLSGLCIGLFGRPSVVAGDIITLNGFRVQIITECTGVYCMVLFGAFVVSVPSSLKSRLTGLLLGVSFLGTVNILRIAFVTMVGAGYPGLFEGVHVYLGQVVMLLLTVAVSLAWKRWATRSASGSGMFLLRATALASIIFPLWLVVNRAYVRGLDHLVAGLFSLADYRLVFPYRHMAYYQTFNVVLLVALILAERRIHSYRKVIWTVGGVAILAAGHLLFRIGNVMLTAFEWQPALPLTKGLTVFGEYLVPILIWLAVAQYSLEKGPSVIKQTRSIMGRF